VGVQRTKSKPHAQIFDQGMAPGTVNGRPESIDRRQVPRRRPGPAILAAVAIYAELRSHAGGSDAAS
jgi:hypothetical protein